MTDAPERIWAWDETGRLCEEKGFREGEWTTEDCSDMRGAFIYTLATPDALVASPEVQALLREAEARVMRIAALQEQVKGLAEALDMAKRHMLVNDLSLPNVFEVIDAALAAMQTAEGEQG